jgi:hypothetical protein
MQKKFRKIQLCGAKKKHVGENGGKNSTGSKKVLYIYFFISYTCTKAEYNKIIPRVRQQKNDG